MFRSHLNGRFSDFYVKAILLKQKNCNFSAPLLQMYSLALVTDSEFSFSCSNSIKRGL